MSVNGFEDKVQEQNEETLKWKGLPTEAIYQIVEVNEVDVNFVEGRIKTRTEYVSLGETIILQCGNTGALTSVWRRTKYLISDGTDINDKAEGNSRFKIAADSVKSQYNLEISNITEEDLGIYWCEVQSIKFAEQTKWTLRLKNKTLIVTREESTTNKLSHTEFVTIPIRFSSSGKIVNYGLLTVCIIVLSWLSVSGIICIIHKYKLGSWGINNNPINVNANSASTDAADLSSNYESICEIELIANAQNLNAELSIEALQASRNSSHHSSPTLEGSSDFLHRMPLPVFDEVFQNEISKSDLVLNVDESSSKDQNIKKYSQTSDYVNIHNEVGLKASNGHIYLGGEISNSYEPLNRNDKVCNYSKLNEEDTLLMINVAELSESERSADENDQRTAWQYEDEYEYPYEILNRNDNEEHDYNILLTQPDILIRK
ncbi:unnamed protein product [Mytilus coruscus]|uniref:Ig-like domain-containing protein n=1 Tax=Mytilus coruscus TaxID=42192 RepID=A0A6J8AH51_MYTCO|nr:unnamed protein product [Mytilus coruscus]